jgi:hypothetical protein
MEVKEPTMYSGRATHEKAKTMNPQVPTMLRIMSAH